MNYSDEMEYKALQPIRERPPFTGFIPRLGAFAFDGLLLYLLAMLLDRSLRPVLLQLNPLLPWLGHILALAYFWLGEGPVGGGRTPGKLFLNLHVVTRTGAAPGWGAAGKRALLKQAPAFMFLAWPVYSAGFGGDIFTLITAFSALQIFGLALTIALAFSIAVHPFKRGWHDHWAATWVTGRPTPPAFQAAHEAPIDEITAGRLRLHPKLTAGLFVIAALVMLLQAYRQLTSPAHREFYTRINELRETEPLPGHRVASMAFPDAGQHERFLEQVRRSRAAAPQTAGEPSTETLRLAGPIYDGRGLVVQALVVRGPHLPAQADELLAGADHLRALLWAQWRQALADWPADSPPPPPAERFSLVLVEPFQILAYNQTLSRGLIEGPAKPGTGPLEYRPLSVDPIPDPPPAPLIEDPIEQPAAH